MDYVKTFFVSDISKQNKDISIDATPPLGAAAYGTIKGVEIIEQNENVESGRVSFFNWGEHANTTPNMVTIIGTAKEPNVLVRFKISVTFEAFVETLQVKINLLELYDGVISKSITPIVWNKGAILNYTVKNITPELSTQDSYQEYWFTGSRIKGYVFHLDVAKPDIGIRTVELELTYAQSSFKVPTSFDVSYDLLGAGGVIPETLNIAVGEIFTIAGNDAVLEDHVLKGWADIDNLCAPYSNYVMPNRQIVFVAVWELVDIPPLPDDASIQGEISGTGSALTRNNEITADRLAIARDFIVGYADSIKDAIGGVIRDVNHDFDCSISLDNNNQVVISDGLAVAYGYFGYSPRVVFDILPPAVLQYHLIYAEWDRSVIPNKFSIKIKNNQSSPYYDTAFRQDVLSVVKTGIFQLPLWRIAIANNGIVDAPTDLRVLREKIDIVQHSDDTVRVLSGGGLHDTVTCITQAIDDSSNKVASTAFVCAAIKAEIDK